MDVGIAVLEMVSLASFNAGQSSTDFLSTAAEQHADALRPADVAVLSVTTKRRSTVGIGQKQTSATCLTLVGSCPESGHCGVQREGQQTANK
jgi:hypothetical protein